MRQCFGRRRDQKGEDGTGHGRIDLLTFAGLRSGHQRPQHTDSGKKTAQRIGISGADGPGIFGIHQYTQHPAQPLTDRVIGRPTDVGTGRTGSRYGAVDDPLVNRTKGFVVDA